MNIVIAGNYSEYEAYMRNHFRYVGDAETLAKIDPKQIENILFVGNFRDHPIYLSDELFNLQVEVSRCKCSRLEEEADGN